jgi:hypothetical protein
VATLAAAGATSFAPGARADGAKPPATSADDAKPPATSADGAKRPAIEAPDGTPITFTSTDVTMRVYAAHGDVPAGTFPDPFEKLPPLPTTVRLAPGTYTLEAESPNSSTGHDRLHVESGAPVTVEVHSGNASVKAFGAVFIGVGTIAAILGIVTIVSISANDASFNRWGIGLPLILGGVGVGGLGIGMTALGSTDIHAPHPPPGGAPKGVALRVQF